MSEETQAQDEAPVEDIPFAVFAFGSVIAREETTITFPGMEAKWYVTARAPDAQGAKRIEAAPLKFADGDAGIELSPNTYAAYIAKCESQITDFCLPQLDAAGQLAGEVRYKRSNPQANREVYNSLNEATVRFVEGALDRIAGRETALAEQYEQLKNASTPSASTG